METSFRAGLLCLVFMLVPVMGFCAPPPAMPLLSGFHQPVSPCPVAAPDIVTMVGRFQGQPGKDVWRVVASATPEDGGYLTLGARLELFDAQCHVVFSEAFPNSPEVSFEILNFGGTAILHVIYVIPGADDVHYTHLLMQEDDGALVSIAPMLFTSDSSSSFYIGPLGDGKTYGVVQSYWPWRSFSLGHNDVSLVFRWRQQTLAGWMSGWFAGPEIFRWPDRWLRLGQNACDTGFPLMNYLFGKGCGG